MTKAQKRLDRLKRRYDENSRIIALQKRDLAKWPGGIMVGRKDNYTIYHPGRRGLLIGGKRNR